MSPLYPLIGAILLAAVHAFSGYLKFLDTIPRHRFLSAGAGITVAFVILQLLPGVAAADKAIGTETGGIMSGVKDHAYAIVLVSIVIFFAVGNWRAQTRTNRTVRKKASAPGLLGSHRHLRHHESPHSGTS